MDVKDKSNPIECLCITIFFELREKCNLLYRIIESDPAHQPLKQVHESMYAALKMYEKHILKIHTQKEIEVVKTSTEMYNFMFQKEFLFSVMQLVKENTKNIYDLVKNRDEGSDATPIKSYVFKINNFNRKMYAIRSFLEKGGARTLTTDTGIWSSPFYSSPNGWLHKLVYVPFKNFDLREKFGSLYVVKIDGPFDKIQPPNFNLVTRMSILKRDKVEDTKTFYPENIPEIEPTDGSIISPKIWGFNKFVSADFLSALLINTDTIYFKVVFDTKGWFGR